MSHEFQFPSHCLACKRAGPVGVCEECQKAQNEAMLLEIQQHIEWQLKHPNCRTEVGTLPIQITGWLKARKFPGKHQFEVMLRAIKEHFESDPAATQIPMVVLAWLWPQKLKSLREHKPSEPGPDLALAK